MRGRVLSSCRTGTTEDNAGKLSSMGYLSADPFGVIRRVRFCLVRKKEALEARAALPPPPDISVMVPGATEKQQWPQIMILHNL